MDKKAQGLSLNTIIIAIIVLIVLVVIIMLFTGYFGSKFTPGVSSCETNGGSCQFPGSDTTAPCGFDSFGSSVAKLSGACPGTQICCSKGLGSGTAPVKDAADCGQKGKAPCSKGEPCMDPMDVGIDGKCDVRLCKQSDWSCTWSECSKEEDGSWWQYSSNCKPPAISVCRDPDKVPPLKYKTCKPT